MPRATSSRSRPTRPRGRSTCSACWWTRCAARASPTRSTSTTARPTAATCWDRVCATRHHAAARQALRSPGARQDGALLADAARRAAWTTSATSPRSRRSTRDSAPSSTSTISARRTRPAGQERPRRCTRPAVPARARSTRPRFASRSPCAPDGACSGDNVVSVDGDRVRARPGLPRRPDRHRRAVLRRRPTSRRGSSTRASASCSASLDPIKNARRKRPPRVEDAAADAPHRLRSAGARSSALRRQDDPGSEGGAQ